MKKKNNGTKFEARVQRVVIAQGVFAERGLIPAATEDHRLLATDIDVLATEYQFNFHRSRSHYECKTGKISILDRVLWMKGVRELLNADGSFLVVANFDPDTLSFAKSLGITLLTGADVAVLEANLGIPNTWWPGRSQYNAVEKVCRMWRSQWSIERPTKEWTMLKQIFSHIQIDSWQCLDYRTLNRAFRMLGDIGETINHTESEEQTECMCFAVGALCVQLAQVIVNCCADLVGHEPTARKEYLSKRLVFGENDSRYAVSLIEGTVELVRQVTITDGAVDRLVLDTSRLTNSPCYSDDFFRLVEQFIENPFAARYVALAGELRLFGPEGDIPSELFQLQFAYDKGSILLDYLIGFIIRNFAIPSTVFTRLPSILSKYEESSEGDQHEFE